MLSSVDGCTFPPQSLLLPQLSWLDADSVAARAAIFAAASARALSPGEIKG
jgi:hypothetical protein